MPPHGCSADDDIVSYQHVNNADNDDDDVTDWAISNNQLHPDGHRRMHRNSINSTRKASLYDLNIEIGMVSPIGDPSSRCSCDEDEDALDVHTVVNVDQDLQSFKHLYADFSSEHAPYYKRFLENLRTRRSKPRAFIIFADLDGTFTPMDLQGKQDFIDVVKEIEHRCSAKVKFVPVSGRPAGYVLRVLHDCRDMLDGAGAVGCCDYGAAEQGGVIVDSARSYGPRYMGKKENMGLKAQIAAILAANKYRDILRDEPDKLYTCSVHITNEAKETMTADEQMDVYKSCRDDIWAKFGKDKLNIPMSHNCMEVMHKDISKARALDELVTMYSKTYNIVGMCMCGDAENDKVALDYMSRLAEIPGVRAHVFTPSNAQRAISTHVVEWWKHERHWTSANRIRKSAERLFRGITWLMRDEMDKGTLVADGCQRWHRSYDDHDLPAECLRKPIAKFL